MRLFPFEHLVEHVPEDSRGAMLDLGCGHGLWPFFLSRHCPDAHVYGIDPDDTKIRLAEEIRQKNEIANITFKVGKAEDADLAECSFASIIDVMYLMTYEQQETVLRNLSEKLEPGATLLVKEMSHTPRWKFLWNWFEEWLAVRAMKITVGQRFYFRQEEDWVALLEDIGFSVAKHRLDRGYIHPHLLFVAIKQD
jgi:2-polyprenyl-3-methyl-5-hydroxy-6-metoxy-1,4-benzoquinol methylase